MYAQPPNRGSIIIVFIITLLIGLGIHSLRHHYSLLSLISLCAAVFIFLIVHKRIPED